MLHRTGTDGLPPLVLLAVALSSWTGIVPREARAQQAVGIIVGTVADASGAAIPGATVPIANEATGATRTMATGASGDFSFPQLQAGHYTLKVSKLGFQAYTQKGILLQVDQSETLHVTLAVGKADRPRPLRRHTGDIYTTISGSLSGGNGTFLQNRTTSEFTDILSWVHTKHTVNAGVEVYRDDVNRYEDYFTDPVLDFDGQYTGNALADLLLGLPDYFREDTEVRSELRHTAVGVFGEDKFKAKSNLTLDLAFRWEPYLPPVDNLNDQVCLDPTFTKKSTFYPTTPPGILFPVVRSTPDSGQGIRGVRASSHRPAGRIPHRG
jgi:Carboxypeptidase regulatory-like domain